VVKRDEEKQNLGIAECGRINVNLFCLGSFLPVLLWGNPSPTLGRGVQQGGGGVGGFFAFVPERDLAI